MPSREKSIRVPKGYGNVEVRADTLDMDQRSVDVIWTTGAPVKRFSLFDGPYIEELVVDDGSVILDRFDGMSVLDGHNSRSMANRIGTVVGGSVRLENGQGLATIRLTEGEMQDRLLRDLANGHPMPISVGYRIHEVEKIECDDGSIPIWRCTQWEPLEISAVPVPADPGSHSRIDESETYPCTLRWDGQDPTPQQQAAQSAQGKEDEAMPQVRDVVEDGNKRDENNAATEPTAQKDNTRSDEDSARAVEQAREAERVRVSQINQLARKHGLDAKVVDEAIEDGRSIDAFRVDVLDFLAAQQEQSPTSPMVSAEVQGARQDEVETRREAITNAILHRARPGEEKLTDAGRQWRNLTLREIARELLRESGQEYRGMSVNDLVGRAMHTTSDFPIILQGVTNRVLLQSYNEHVQTFRPFCRQATAPDFREMTRVQLGEVGELLEVNEAGEFKRTTLSEGKESYKIGTYGRVVSISRQMIINDDLGAFTNLAGKFGNAIARLESQVVWEIFTKNATMSDGKALFHADHGNYVTGAGTALSEASLDQGFQAMAQQKDMDGTDYLDIMPKFLIVPPSLRAKATKLLGVVNPTKSDDFPLDYIQSLVPIVEPRLSSSTNWYLAAEPSMIDTIEYAYLEGEAGPYTEQQMGFDIDGIDIKVRLDFGAAALDYRGLFKSKGAA